MDGISSRKLTWGICIAGIAIAIISFFFFNTDTPSDCYNLEWYKKYKVCSDAFEDLANSWSI